MAFPRWTLTEIGGISKAALAPRRGTLCGATATFTCSTSPLFSCHVNEYVLQGLPGQREGGVCSKDLKKQSHLHPWACGRALAWLRWRLALAVTCLSPRRSRPSRVPSS